MSRQQDQDRNMTASQQNEVSVPDATSPNNAVKKVAASEDRGYDYKGYPRPGDNDHFPMYPGINHNSNENLERMFKANYLEMMENFNEGKREVAEAMAQELLGWRKLPTLHRTYSHIVLAYGAQDGLLHAQKAVEEAERALLRFGDAGIGEKVLAHAKETLEAVQKAHGDKVEQEADSESKAK
ncbi:hypothetical protein M436DRAFT_86122 [Aureobasidium namibiae CBS 147.97]|uniref:Uncharacterized protein n=1 Tax=Aureobasidium namibiae CBS 147.97 TaxID=1043004 RepID=A0A074W7B0_9PEZI